MINLQNCLHEHFHKLLIPYPSLKWMTKSVSWGIKTHDIHVLQTYINHPDTQQKKDVVKKKWRLLTLSKDGPNL